MKAIIMYYLSNQKSWCLEMRSSCCGSSHEGVTTIIP